MAACPGCGTENPEIARFCMVCGGSLEAAASPTQEERKVVSILFVDLVGFTARSHAADPEDVRATLQPYHALLKREIERFGGTVEKFIGDAVMAVFGAPVAHEDDAERAVRAALRISETLEELNESTPNLELSIRAAVNTGEGLVNLSAHPQAGEGMVTGDVVNTASRLQGIAPVGGIAVGEITHRATKDVIAYEQLEPVSLKGKPDPVPVWRAVSARSRFGIDLDRARSTPFIGRTYEQTILKETFRRALRESSIQLVTVVGEPGVGKSRLLSEFFAFVDDQEEIVFYRQGRCLPYGDGITFWALGEIVKAHAGILGSDSSEEASEKLRSTIEAVVPDALEHGWFSARLAPLVGAAIEGAGSAEREESFTAWRRFLEAIAERSPLVVVFEDLHWADTALLEFIEHVIEWSSGVRLFVLCTARPELFDKHPGWGAGHRNGATLSLSPLDDSETAQLISGLLSQAVLPAEVHSTLLERAGGNPLYAEEFIRMLSDRGILTKRGRVLTIDAAADIPVPDSVHALIAARLDTLSVERKGLLHDAAVIGKVFWSGALSAIGDLDEAGVTQGLHELAKKELVRPARRSSIEGQREYAFWHALIRDVSYSQIPRTARAASHMGIAEWLQKIAGGRVADLAEVLAHHYSQALELNRAAANQEQVTELQEPTMRFLVMAGDRALHLDATKAEAYYREALQLLPTGHSMRGSVLLKAVEALGALARFDESKRYAEEAISEFRVHDDILGAGKALVKLGSMAWNLGDSGRSHQIIGEGIDLLEKASRGSELCYAYTAYSMCRCMSGFPSEGMKWADKALTLANELGDEENLIRALGCRGISRVFLGDLGGLVDGEEALQRSLDRGDAYMIALNYNNLAYSLEVNEGPRRAVGLYNQAAEFAATRGLAGWTTTMQVNAAINLYRLGDWDEALEQAGLVARWGVDQHTGPFESAGLLVRAWVLLARGHLKEAAKVEKRLLELVRDVSIPENMPAFVVAARLHIATSDSAAAVGLVGEMVERTKDNLEWQALELPDAIRVLILAGRLDLAADLLLDDTDVHSTLARHCVATARALLAESGGDLDEALTLYEETVARWTEFGFVFEEGQAHLGAGRCLVKLGRHDESSAHLHAAREIFTKLQAHALLDEVDAHLHQAKAL